MANTIIQQVTAELDTLQKELSQFKSSVAYLNDVKGQMKEAKQIVTSAEQQFVNRSQELKQAFNDVISFKAKLENLTLKIDNVDFPKRLDSIENSFVELLEIEQSLSAQLRESISSLNNQINTIDFNKKHEELRKDVSRLEENNEKLINVIKEIDIPKRIETFKYSINTKLENTAAELEKNTKKISEDATQTIKYLNIPGRLDKVDTNISGLMTAILSIQNRIESHELTILDKMSDLREKIDTSLKRQNGQSNLGLIILIIVILNIILFSLKHFHVI